MKAAGDLANARPSRIVEQVFDRPKQRGFVTLARCRAEVLLARFQDVVELALCGAGE